MQPLSGPETSQQQKISLPFLPSLSSFPFKNPASAKVNPDLSGRNFGFCEGDEVLYTCIYIPKTIEEDETLELFLMRCMNEG